LPLLKFQPTYNKKMEANWIDHIWSRNCLLKHVNKENIEEISGEKARKKTYAATGYLQKIIGPWILKEEALRSPSVQSLLWKRLWTSLKRGYRIN